MAKKRKKPVRRIRGNQIAIKAEPLQQLTPSKLEYVEARAAGMNQTEAAKAVGISKRYAHSLESDKQVQLVYRDLIREAIPTNKLVNLIKGGTEATMPVYGPDGKKKRDRPDWKARKPYIEMAVEHGGYFEKKVEAAQTMIAVTVQHVGNSGPSKPTLEVTTEAIGTPRAVPELTS